ncbi:putative hydro-lyase [Deferribacter autotrophicus]|nr:putative hydro-lyase [Deferribacter autotrophicus]
MKESEKIRRKIRDGEFVGQTSGVAPGYAQANLVVLPKKYAFDFLLFIQRNPKPCPLLEVTDVGSPYTKQVADNADLRTDIPKYRVYEKGKLVDEPIDITSYWNDDLVAFLLGCSFSFEWALLEAGIPVRHIEANRNVPMYITNIQTNPAGVFHGPLVVSMRSIPYDLVVKATNITARFPSVHGAPVHIGYPELIGIYNLNKPDYGDPPIIKENDIPVFWACGVTPQAVAVNSKIDFMITHSPGHMFVTDLKNQDFALF